MPLPVFEIACVIVVALTLASMSRARALGPLLRDYAAIAVAAWIGEDTSHRASTASTRTRPGGTCDIHHVPVLVPLIWPLVVLSARDVVSRALACARRIGAPLVVGAVVAFDASLVEVVAVRAGTVVVGRGRAPRRPAHRHRGWGYFAVGADVALSRRRPGLALVTGPLATHALDPRSRGGGSSGWTLRGDLGARLR